MDSQTSPPTLNDFAYLPTAKIHLIIATIVGVSSLLAFYPTFPTTVGKSLAGWTWHACNSSNGFLHGRLVPLILPWLMYLALRRSKHLPLNPSYLGLLPLLLGLLLFWAGARIIQPRISLLGAPFLILGVTWYFLGARITRRAIFPAFFLYFAISIPGIAAAINGYLAPFILRIVSQLGTLIGVTSTVSNYDITTSNGSSLIVRDALRHGLLFTTLMTAAVLSYLTQRTIWKQWFLVVFSFPLLILFTISKLLLAVILLEIDRREWAHLIYFEFGSFLILLLTTLTLLITTYLLTTLPRPTTAS